MGESSQNADSLPQIERSRNERIKELWEENWSSLVKAILISAFIHFAISIPIIFSPSLSSDFDVDWHGEMGDLSGIGHGIEDFDPDEEVDWEELQDIDEAREEEEPDEEPEEEEPDEEPEEEEPEEEPKEEEPEEEEPEEEEDPVEEEPEEEIAEEEAEKEEEPEEEIAEEEVDDDFGVEAEDTEDEPAEETATEVADTDVSEPDAPRELPGVDRSSPSNLPDLRNYGPGNARVTTLVRTDRLRGTDLEPHVDTLLRAVPDYRIALEGTQLDPVEELDAIFMASANPNYLHETFLAVRHRFDNEEMKTLLDQRFSDPIEWETRQGSEHPVRRLVPESANYRDPRRLLLAESGLAIMGRPGWFEDLIGPVDEDSELGRELAEYDDGPSTFALLDGLERIEEAAESEDTLLLFSAYGFTLRDIPMVDDFPRVHATRLEIADAENPTLTIDLRLRNEQAARQLQRDCPSFRRQLRNVLRFVNLHTLVEPLECRQEGDYVVIEGQYSQEEVQTIIERAVPLIEATGPRSLEGLPEPPTPEPEPESEPEPEQELEPEQESDLESEQESEPEPNTDP